MAHKTVSDRELRHGESLQLVGVPEQIRHSFAVAEFVTGSRDLLLYGGGVRNLLLGTETTLPDYDFIGDFDPDQLVQRHPDLVVGRWDEVQTLRLRIGQGTYDFTWSKKIEERLRRNDITISNLAMTKEGEVLDFFGALGDLQARQIRMIEPDSKLIEDPTRILRAFRFAAELGFKIEEETLQAIKRQAPLLRTSPNLSDDYFQILTIQEIEVRDVILAMIANYGIDKYINVEPQMYRDYEVYALEQDLHTNRQVGKVREMFADNRLYLVGGALRDMIWKKRYMNDLDFKIEMGTDDMVHILEKQGFTRAADYNTSEGQYYISEQPGVVGFVFGGVDIHLASIPVGSTVESIIGNGDLNFSCCMYDIHSGRIINPDTVENIRLKRLRFASPGKAREDPTIITNALKQIARLPDIEVDEETAAIIKAGTEQLREFYELNPVFKYRLADLCGQLNSEAVYRILGPDVVVLDGFERKKQKLKTGLGYTSMPLSDLTPEDTQDVYELIRRSYGKNYDDGKARSNGANSIIFERDAEGRIVTCCLVDGERLYTVAARQGYDWMRIVADAASHNPNVWLTAGSAYPKIHAFCSVAGLRIERNPEVIRRILQNNTSKYKEVEVFELDGMVVFRKKGMADDTSQLLLRS